MKKQDSFKRNALLILFLFTSVTAVSYGLGTWNTGYRATNGGVTLSTTNQTGVFDKVEVDNSYGSDIFVPTKTFGELKSLWENTPANVELITEKETFNSMTINAAFTFYIVYNAGDCDNHTGSNGVTHYWGNPAVNPQSNYVTYTRYNILKIDVPEDIEAYLNIRGVYDGDQVEENLYIYKQKEGGSNVGITQLHGLYKTTATTINPPILDYNNDGTDDIEAIYIPDQFNNGLPGTQNRTAKTPSKVKLFAGSNYIRVESGSTNSGFACQSGSFASTASISFQHTGGYEGYVWLSSD